MRKARAARLAGGLAGTLAALISQAAFADPWVPAAGHGSAKTMLRFYKADRAFPGGGFGTDTEPASKRELTQIRVLGVHGLGHRLSLEYDLRFGDLRTSRLRHRQLITQSSTGLQDQEVGLNYGFRQTPGFADSMTFSVIAPTGRTSPAPALGTGHWSVESAYQMGLSHGRVGFTLKAGPRVFLDSGITQLRTDAGLAVRPFPRVTLTGTAFLVRTPRSRQNVPLADRAELYDLLRLGVSAQYRVTRQVRPFVTYEKYVAGDAIHAGQRVSLGLSVRY